MMVMEDATSPNPDDGEKGRSWWRIGTMIFVRQTYEPSWHKLQQLYHTHGFMCVYTIAENSLVFTVKRLEACAVPYTWLSEESDVYSVFAWKEDYVQVEPTDN